MQRETFEVNTLGGHKAVLNTYITGGEKRQIVETYLNGKAERTEAEKIFASEDLSIRIVVQSLDGSSDNIVARLLELPADDMKDITDAVSPVVEGKKK